MLLPALAKAKAKGKQAVCISNLKQWGLVWQFYCDENDGKFSQGIGTSNMNGGWWRGECVAALEKFWRKQTWMRPSFLNISNARQAQAKADQRHLRQSFPLV